MLEGIAQSGVVKGRHHEGLRGMLIMSWNLGFALGLLDLLGEVPSSLPPRLP